LLTASAGPLGRLASDARPSLDTTTFRTRSANTVTPSYTGPALEPRNVQALAPFGLFTLPYRCLASIAPTG